MCFSAKDDTTNQNPIKTSDAVVSTNTVPSISNITSDIAAFENTNQNTSFNITTAIPVNIDSMSTTNIINNSNISTQSDNIENISKTVPESIESIKNENISSNVNSPTGNDNIENITNTGTESIESIPNSNISNNNNASIQVNNDIENITSSITENIESLPNTNITNNDTSQTPTDNINDLNFSTNEEEFNNILTQENLGQMTSINNNNPIEPNLPEMNVPSHLDDHLGKVIIVHKEKLN